MFNIFLLTSYDLFLCEFIAGDQYFHVRFKYFFFVCLFIFLVFIVRLKFILLSIYLFIKYITTSNQKELQRRGSQSCKYVTVKSSTHDHDESHESAGIPILSWSYSAIDQYA